MFQNNQDIFCTPNAKQGYNNPLSTNDPSTADTMSATSAFSVENGYDDRSPTAKCLNFNNEVSGFPSNNNLDYFDKINSEIQNSTIFSKRFQKNQNPESTNKYQDSMMIQMMENMVLNNQNSKLNSRSQYNNNNFDDISPFSVTKKSSKKKGDRFIPNRKTSKLDIALTSAHDLDENYYKNINDPDRLKGKDINETQQVSVLEMYKSHVLGIKNNQKDNNVIEEEGHQNTQQQNIFCYQDENAYNKNQYTNQYSGLNNPLCSLEDMILNKNDIINKYNPNKQNHRKISKIPFKVLDAPQLQDDFYLNLIEWSSQNQLAVALASCVYLWSASTNKVIKFCDLGNNDLVTSVQWNPQGTLLSIGTSLGELQIWDAQKLTKIKVLGGHSARIGSLAWSNHLLSSGSRDKTILQRDLRANNEYVKKLLGHKQEVCGLKWSFDGQQLASGGNDNKLLLWNIRNETPVAKFTSHTAAVKALAWSPHQHSLLASGGGTADRTIRFWNTHTHEQVNHIDTGSQVCNLMFSKNQNELVSTHGYSMNQICLWKYPTMEKIADLYGHTSRVLFLAANPEGDTIVTGAGDETLRFWKLFPEQQQKKLQSSLLVGDMRSLR